MKEFYCQFCGAKVSINSTSCPNCKKEFDSILCPKCLFSGSAMEFKNGCPSCGYLKEVKPNRKEQKVLKLTTKLFLILLTLLISVIGYFTFLLIK